MTHTRLLTFGILLCVCQLSFAQQAENASPTLGDAERIRLRRTPVVDVFERCKGAVVNISTTQIVEMRSSFPFDSLFDDLFDFPTVPGETRRYATTAVGSGFVLHQTGYIVTNAHVVARTAERKVIFADKSEYEAEIVAMDTERDLALLKIDVDHSIPKLALGRSDDVMVGETVIAIGNPMGLESTVTSGVVSALNRQLEVRGEVALDGLIQTDASINPGNSGGPLLNVLGELIGITTAIRGDAQNIGFAIPVDHLVESLPEFLNVERRYRVIAGLEVDPFRGAAVKSVVPETPAHQAGVRNGDRIRSIDGQPVSSGIDYYIAMIGRSPGERIALDVERQGKLFRASLSLVEMPKPNGLKLAEAKLGATVEPLTEAVARRLQLPAAQGLMITKVEPAGPAARSGIEPADIVVQLGTYSPSTVDDLGLLLEDVPAGAAIPLSILRVGKRLIYRLRTEVEAR